MKVIKNPVTGINEILIDGVLTRMPSPDNMRANSNGTKWGLATIHVTYPDGSEDDVNGALYAESIATGLFNEGDKVQLRVQVEGDYAGNAVVQLPAATQVDISKFDFTVPAAKKEVEATA